MDQKRSCLISQKFPPFGCSRDVPLLRYQWLVAVYYDCALECLANERLENVKHPG